MSESANVAKGVPGEMLGCWRDGPTQRKPISPTMRNGMLVTTLAATEKSVAPALATKYVSNGVKTTSMGKIDSNRNSAYANAKSARNQSGRDCDPHHGGQDNCTLLL